MVTEEETAYHEAGHAVMAFETRTTFARMTFSPDPDKDDRLGWIDWGRGRPTRRVANVLTRTGDVVPNPRLNAPRRRTHKQDNALLSILLGGVAAQTLYRHGGPIDVGKAIRGEESGFDQVVESARELLGLQGMSGVEFNDERMVVVTADRLYERDPDICIVGRLGEVVMTLSLPGIWTGVETIARELQARRKLSGRLARRIYEASFMGSANVR